jgi:topoisomerase-4 subunit A
MTDGGLHGLFEDNFLEYASYVIKDRAIPDESDGLKPVQRRILWSLQEMDDGRFNKVANVIGHCMRFHPHGDQSIGDALVTLANRGYFIDRQGNFGNPVTGDEASASRYIECRLTDLARETLFDDRLTEFADSYDGRNREPVALPAKIPVVLLLGAEGIAVGMSTRILPHNFCEVIQAQIACLRGQPFSLYPDFPHGGSIDPSGYSDGTGRVRNRAVIEKRKGVKKLVIREVPWGTTTESLIASIENAARKGKIRISSIDDFTAESVEIEVTLARGVEPEETIQQLYAHTDCEVGHTPSPLVIRDGRPVECTVSDMVRHSTSRLLEILRQELTLELEDLGARLRWMTLEQIFIENRLYKSLEKASSEKALADAVRSGMAPHLGDLVLGEDDIAKLLAVKIRRISQFDMEAHRSEMGDIGQKMTSVRKSLGSLKQHAVSWLQGLLKKYGKQFPRRTRIEAFTEIDVKEVSRRNLKVGYDPKGGFVGTGVKGDMSFDASEYDRIAAFFTDGTYRILPMAEKHFLEKEVAFCGLHDKERVYTAVYREPAAGLSYGKRFRVEGYILEKEYAFVPEGASLLLFSDAPSYMLEFWFERRKRMKARKGEMPSEDIGIKGASARGIRVGGSRVITSIRAVLPEKPPEPPAGGTGEGEALDGEGRAGPEAPKRSPEQLVGDAEALRERSSRLLEEASKMIQSDLFEGGPGQDG